MEDCRGGQVGGSLPMSKSRRCMVLVGYATQGKINRSQQAALQARDAYRKDAVALIGMDVNTMAETWTNPDRYTVAYWFRKLPEPRTQGLLFGRHRRFSASSRSAAYSIPKFGEKRSYGIRSATGLSAARRRQTVVFPPQVLTSPQRHYRQGTFWFWWSGRRILLEGDHLLQCF